MGMITLLIGGLTLAFVLYMPFPFVVKTWLRRKFLAEIRKSGYVCLTFDDGPCPEVTTQILALLKQHGIQATFFLVGEKVAKYPDMADKIAADGHEIGEHSYSHSHPWKCNPLRSAIDLIKGGQALKRYQAFQSSICFRPPYGKLNLFTLIYAWIMRKRIAFWDVDPRDYRVFSGKEVAKKVIEQIRLGSVILLHDGRNGLNGSTAQVTVTATQLILESAVKSRLRFATIGEALYPGQEHANNDSNIAQAISNSFQWQ